MNDLNDPRLVRLESRIRAAFASELRRAELDASALDAAPVTLVRRRSTGRTLGLALAGLAVVVIALGGGLLVAQARFAVSQAGPASTSPAVSASVQPQPSPTKSGPPATPTLSDGIPRYSDGIPDVWEGQPVIRWDQALQLRMTLTDSTPFLVGVWLTVQTGPVWCPADTGPDPSAPDSWIPTGGCIFSYVGADAGAQIPNESQIVTFKFAGAQPATGSAIMRVHVNDPRATQCGYRASTCAQMIVVDQILWTGDAATDPYPLDVADVMAATKQASPTSDLQAPGPSVWGCGASLTSGLTMCPPLETGKPYDTPIVGAVVLPSVNAVARALPDVVPGLEGVSAAAAKISTGTLTIGNESWTNDYRWLVVDNVAIVVRTTPGGPSDAGKAFLSTLIAALKARE